MEKGQETRTCGKCHRDIVEANFDLHQTHCSRFLSLCPDCGEAVPTEQVNQHKEEQHTQVKCPKCNQRMERCQLPDHESTECEERLQTCQFCELELPCKDLDEHSLVCGSRTELCKDCGRYVTLRDQPEHDLTCSDTNNPSGPLQTASPLPPNHDEMKLGGVPAARCDDEADEPDENGREDEDDWSGSGAVSQLSSTFKATSLSDRPGGVPWANGGDPHQISTCPHCHLALPLRTLRWHEVKCRRHVLMK